MSELKNALGRNQNMPNVYQASLLQLRPQMINPNETTNHECILWFLGVFGTGMNNTQLTTVQSTFDTAFATFWNQFAGLDSHYKSCFVTDWSSNLGLQVTPNVTINSPGSGGGALPSQVSMLQSNHFPLRYRGGHGRSYWPLIGSTAVTGDTIGGTTLANAGTNWAAILTAMGGLTSTAGGPYIQVVYKFRNNAAKASLQRITSTTFQAKVATQRRRLRKAPHH